MIDHPEEAKAYSQLKFDLAHQNPTDIDAYIRGKNAFVSEINKKVKDEETRNKKL